MWPNGQIYNGGAGSYQFAVQCDGVGGCDDIASQAVVNNAKSFINGLGAAQLGGNGQGNITLNVLNNISPNFGGYAIAISSLQPNGTVSNSCSANIGVQNIAQNIVGLGIPLDTVPNPTSQSTQAFTNLVIHEILHCMGLGHSDNPMDIMTNGANGTPDQAFRQLTSPPSIDPAEVNVLKQIAGGQNLQVEDCVNECDAGHGYVLKNNLDPNSQGDCVSQSDLCEDSSMLWNDQTQSCQTCQAMGYPAGWTAAQDEGVCALEVSGSVEPLPAIPSPNEMCLLGMQWSSSTQQCVPSENVTSNICYVLQDGTCSCPGYVQQNGVCVSATGGYACDENGSCVYNSSGGPFDNSSCDDACLGAPGTGGE